MAALGVRSIPPNPRVSVLEAADLAKRLDAEAVGAVMESCFPEPWLSNTGCRLGLMGSTMVEEIQWRRWLLGRRDEDGVEEGTNSWHRRLTCCAAMKMQVSVRTSCQVRDADADGGLALLLSLGRGAVGQSIRNSVWQRSRSLLHGVQGLNRDLCVICAALCRESGGGGDCSPSSCPKCGSGVKLTGSILGGRNFGDRPAAATLCLPGPTPSFRVALCPEFSYGRFIGPWIRGDVIPEPMDNIPWASLMMPALWPFLWVVMSAVERGRGRTVQGYP